MSNTDRTGVVIVVVILIVAVIIVILYFFVWRKKKGPSNTGDACSDTNPCTGGKLICLNNTCQPNNTTTGGQGSNCTSASDCDFGYYCSGIGTCNINPSVGTGGSCTGDVNCVYGQYCISSICTIQNNTNGVPSFTNYYITTTIASNSNYYLNMSDPFNGVFEWTTTIPENGYSWNSSTLTLTIVGGPNNGNPVSIDPEGCDFLPGPVNSQFMFTANGAANNGIIPVTITAYNFPIGYTSASNPIAVALITDTSICDMAPGWTSLTNFNLIPRSPVS